MDCTSGNYLLLTMVLRQQKNSEDIVEAIGWQSRTGLELAIFSSIAGNLRHFKK